MFRLTFKHVVANKIRFALTTFGITLAVSFVVAAFVLGDGLRSSFTDVSEDITAGVDLEVRNAADFGDTPPLPASTVDTVEGISGVADAASVIEAAENAVRPIPPDGGVISTNGPPQLAFNWIDNPELSPFTLVEGRAPQRGEFTIDVDSAREHSFVIGDSYELSTPAGTTWLTLSGTTSFGADNKTLGAVLMQMNTAESGALFGIDGVSTVAVQLADEADPGRVQAAIAAAVAPTSPNAEVVDHDTVLEETTSEFTDEINVVGNLLLGFGGVALFVSAFIIYNTFGIVMGQRTRELALLRSVGAFPRQIRRSVLGEALSMGGLASVLGIGGGVVVAKGIDALFGLMGVDLSEWPVILAPRTLIAALVIGIGVTVVSALGPARRASSIPPVAALAGHTDAAMAGTGRRVIVGFALGATGSITAAAGLAGIGSTSTTVAALAFGALAILSAVTILSPLAVPMVTRVAALPMRAAGVAGRLAQRNAARNSRRTSTTAAALMVGLAMVTMGLVVGQSVKSTLGNTIDRSAKAEYFVTDELEEVGFPSDLASDIRTIPGVDAATGFTQLEARVSGAVTDVVAFDFDQIDHLLDVGVTAGGFASGNGSVSDRVAVSVEQAGADGVSVGDHIDVEFADGTRTSATVVALFDDQAVMTEDYLVDSAVLDGTSVDTSADWLAMSTSEGASPAQAAALVAGLESDYPLASVETTDEFADRIAGEIDKILAMVNVLVGLAVVIALIGIANTLALSVFERTRELGLLRAVGMTRRQLRRMVRFEAALVAVFGASLGAGVGLLFGAGVVSALPESLADGVSVPVGQIVVMILVAALAGIAAAWLPARRASRLDVLEAIAV